MNTCEPWAALLDGFVDDALSPEEREAVREHLASCQQCRDYVTDALAMRQLFGTVDDEEVPGDFTASVMARVAQHPRKKRRFMTVQLAMMGAVACLSLLVVGKVFLPSTNTSTTMDAAAPMMASEAVPEMAVEEIGVEASPRLSMSTTSDDQVRYAQQGWVECDDVGDLLVDYLATVLDDGATAYQVSAAVFAELMEALPQMLVEDGVDPTTSLCQVIVLG